MKRRAQRSFDFRRRTRAGKLAKKPGRKRLHASDPLHRTRAEHDARHPVHVVLRVTREVRALRGFAQYHAIRGALGTAAAREDFRVVHISIQSNHLHLMCEAESKPALARGMQGLTISAAKRLNRALGRKRGTVFAYRYHATAITGPTQTRNTIAYVLNNWRKHGAARRWRVDPFSSAPLFNGWSRPHGHAPPKEPLPVVAPMTWLLRAGWRRAGAIRFGELPQRGIAAATLKDR